MKKYLITLFLFMVLAHSVYSELHGKFQIGHNLEDTVAFTQIKLSYDFDIWEINTMLYGSITTWFMADWERMFNQSPFRNIYEGGLKNTVGIFFIDLNYFCNHAVYATYSKNDWYDMRWSDAMTTLSFGVEW